MRERVKRKREEREMPPGRVGQQPTARQIEFKADVAWYMRVLERYTHCKRCVEI